MKLHQLTPVVLPGMNYRGRPIMVVQNSYATGLFNGDVGLLWPDADGRLHAWFEQEQESRVLSPEILYTGITRAREHLYLLCSETICTRALETRGLRYSGLAEHIKRAGK